MSLSSAFSFFSHPLFHSLSLSLFFFLPLSLSYTHSLWKKGESYFAKCTSFFLLFQRFQKFQRLWDTPKRWFTRTQVQKRDTFFYQKERENEWERQRLEYVPKLAFFSSLTSMLPSLFLPPPSHWMSSLNVNLWILFFFLSPYLFYGNNIRFRFYKKIAPTKPK